MRLRAPASLRPNPGLLFVALLAPMLCGAQSKSQLHADLSGKWKLNREKSNLRVWARMTPETLVIRQLEKEIKFEREINGKHSSVSYETDGLEQLTSSVDHHERFARARWSKRALVIEERTVAHFTGTPDVEDVETMTIRWLLSNDGSVLTEKNSERGTTAVFDRQR
jgi:hypothetical protein